MHEFLKKNSTFVNVSIKNNKYGSDSIEEYTEGRKKCIGEAAYHYAPDLCRKHYNHRFVQIDGTKCAYRNKVCG